MPNWVCFACKTENGLLDSYCKSCRQPRALSWGAMSSRIATGTASESLRSQSRSILDDVGKELLGARREPSPPSGPLSMAPSEPESEEEELPDLPSFADIGAGPQFADAGRHFDRMMQRAGAPPFQRVTNRDLKIKIKAMPRLNYSLVHCGLPLISSLQITNVSGQPLNDVVLKAWIAPDYSDPWQKTLPGLGSGKKHKEKNLQLPLIQSRLQRIQEAEEGCLRLDVFSEGQLRFSDTYPMRILAYSEWYYHPEQAEALACFVRPNCDAVEKIISLVRDRLRRENRSYDLDGYQEKNPRKVLEMLEALYSTLQQDLKLTYINPPPSFESGESLWESLRCISQKVFFAEDILEYRRGTCLDLALLGAACIERMGLHPVCFLIKGHAFLGAWMDLQTWMVEVLFHLGKSVWKKHSPVSEMVTSGTLLPLNSTTFATSSQRSFQACQEEGMQCLRNPKQFMCAVDVASAHRHAAKPLP